MNRPCAFLISMALIAVSLLAIYNGTPKCSLLADHGRICWEEIDGRTGHPYLVKYGTFLVRLAENNNAAYNITIRCGPVLTCAGSPDRACEMPLSVDPIYYCNGGMIHKVYPIFEWQILIWIVCSFTLTVILCVCIGR
jgi:hypothetical protein